MRTHARTQASVAALGWQAHGGAGAREREGGRLRGEAYLVRIDVVLPHLRRQLARHALVCFHLTQPLLSVRRW